MQWRKTASTVQQIPHRSRSSLLTGQARKLVRHSWHHTEPLLCLSHHNPKAALSANPQQWATVAVKALAGSPIAGDQSALPFPDAHPDETVFQNKAGQRLRLQA
jgi:hypothetical protein